MIIDFSRGQDRAGNIEKKFTTAQAGLAKYKWVFQWARPKKKKKRERRKTNNVVTQTGEKKKNNNVLDIGDNKSKCANEMCLSLFITRL